MTIRLSTGLRNNIVGPTGVAASFAGGVLDIYSGSQPATADSAISGTLLGRVSLASVTYVPETPASATLTLAGASGSINVVTVGTFNIIPLGAVNFVTDLTVTAAALADAINRNGIYTATSSGAVVTVKAPAGTGDAHNGLALAYTATTMTATSSGNITGGVDATAGLQWGVPSAGTVSKSGTWGFSGLVAGTAGWFRIKASALDTDAASSVSYLPVRLDGSIAVSGADMNLSNISIAVGAPTTIDSLTITMPAS